MLFNGSEKELTMGFVTFLQYYDGGRSHTYERSVRVTFVKELQNHDEGCVLFFTDGERVASPSPFEQVLRQVNCIDPLTHGDINGIRCADIVAIVPGPLSSVDIHLRSGAVLNRNDMSVKEYLEQWRLNT